MKKYLILFILSFFIVSPVFAMNWNDGTYTRMKISNNRYEMFVQWDSPSIHEDCPADPLSNTTYYFLLGNFNDSIFWILGNKWPADDYVFFSTDDAITFNGQPLLNHEIHIVQFGCIPYGELDNATTTVLFGKLINDNFTIGTTTATTTQEMYLFTTSLNSISFYIVFSAGLLIFLFVVFIILYLFKR